MKRTIIAAAAAAAMLTGCPAQVQRTGEEVDGREEVGGPPEAASPLLFVVAQGEARLMGRDGAVLKRMPVSIEGRFSVVDQARGSVFVIGADAIDEISLGLDAPPRRVAELGEMSGNGCLAGSPMGGLIQRQGDVGLAEGGGGLCLNIQDRNDNMADTRASVRVPFEGGAITSATIFAADHCGAAEVEAICAVDESRQPGQGSAGGALIEVEVEGCRAVVQGTDAVIDFEAMGMTECPEGFEGTSISGRFAAFSVPTSEGDYIYRRLMIVDLQEGAHLKALDREIVGESRVSWSTQRDALLVDQELFLLGAQAQAVPLNGTATWLE